MECEVAISRICAIFDALSIKIKELIKESSDTVNITVDKYDNSCSAMWNLIKILDCFRDVVKKRIRTSPTLERERASNLANALVNEKKARVEAESLWNLRKSEGVIHQNYVNDIKIQIAEEKLQLDEIKKNHEQEITKKINESKCVMEKIVEETLEKEGKLRTEIELKKLEFENICNVNLKDEKELYSTRKKAEYEYLQVLSMYDKNVGGLYRTMESLTVESNLLNTNLEICQKKLIIQENIYESLKNEKELKIQMIFTENLNKFQRNRAAKIIQKAWRRYLERLLLRKKKKSKKKK